MAQIEGKSKAPDPSSDRADFVKRLFAVSVSVGFAAQLNGILSRAIANKAGLLEIFAQHGRALVLLAVAMIAVVGSWEGYLNSIARTPLRDRARFYVDIVIVFAYLVLMLTCDAPQYWFWVLAAIFAIYIVWDLLSIHYRRTHGEPGHANVLNHSLSITTIWFVLFVAIAMLGRQGTTLEFGLTAGATGLALVFYRVDKDNRTAPLYVRGVLLIVPALLLLSSAKS